MTLTLGPPITPWRAFKADPADWFSPEEIATSRRYLRGLRPAQMAKAALGVVVTLAIIGFGITGKVIRFLGGGPWELQVAEAVAMLIVADSICGLGFAAWRELSYDKRWERSNQTPRQFVTDQVKNLAIGAVLLSVLAVPIWAVVRATSLWWLWAWVIFALFTAVLATLFPVVILPRFNTFTPLEDGELRTALLATARLVEADVSEILVEDTSKRDRRTNAYVAGLGRTRRLVICDTMVVQPPDELTCVAAHELGHWKLRHSARLVPFMVVTSLVAFAVVGATLPTHTVLRFAHARSLADPVMVLPFLGLFMVALALTNLATAWLSRVHERQADLFALEALGASCVPSFLAMMRTLYTYNLADLTPGPWKRLKATHPHGAERLAMTSAWAARRDSKSPTQG